MIQNIYLYCGGQGADQLIDLVGGVVAAPNEHDLVRLGERRRDLRRDGGQRLQHQRHHRRVPVLEHRGVRSVYLYLLSAAAHLFVGRGLHAHALRLGATHGLHGAGVSCSDQPGHVSRVHFQHWQRNIFIVHVCPLT